jgi:(p)ppGpp synthase/HD superfamily hydrolase
VSAPPFIADLPTTCRAYEFAAAVHREQLRESDAAPFILHPLEVAVLLCNRGFDDEVVAAALLHDAVEDTPTTADDLRSEFGDRIADLVSSLSDDESIEGYAERKAALREQVVAAGSDALAIFAADKVAKARELRATLVRTPGSEPDEAKLQHYEQSLEMLEQHCSGLALVRQLRFELWALRHLPPSS